MNYLADAVSVRDAFAFNAVKIRFSAISGVKRSIRNLECNLHRKTRELNFAARNQRWWKRLIRGKKENVEGRKYMKGVNFRI